MQVRLALACAAICAVLGGACSSSSGKQSDARTADVYTAVIRSVLASTADGKDQVIWIAPFPDRKSVEIETQAAVIAALSDEATVRFVDALSEAVADGEEDAPAKDGVVMQLGAVPPSGDTVDVDGELYRAADDRTNLRFRASVVDESWTAEVVSRQPTPTTTTSA